MDLPERIVLASANPAKARELESVLEGLLRSPVVLEPRPDWVPDVLEDASDFEGNARLKAAALCAATGLASLADDSGLEVDGLDGRPGVHSARYAAVGDGAVGDGGDEANVVKLLGELESVPDTDGRRAARFRCVIVLQHPDGSELVASGVVEGRIAMAPRGEGGFGYDPVFVPFEGDGRTFAEMEPREKHRISHRGRALRELAAALGPQD